MPISDPPMFAPGPTLDTVIGSDGVVCNPPAGWSLLAPGDAALTRRVKAAGEFWLVQQKKGRRTFSKGVWAPSKTIERIRRELDAERSTETYAKRKVADKERRERTQATYVDEFYDSVLSYLHFDPRHQSSAAKMARAITDHATPVGSGTVARTKRISLEQRAEAAVIAWMRHQTTAYDSMKVPREKGKRREVRRMLAKRSKELLSQYQAGGSVDQECPLRKALS